MKRREFVKTAALVSGMATMCRGSLYGADQASLATADPFVGIQIAPHSFYDEGFDHCLDLLHESGGVNALMISSLAYYGAMGRPLNVLADHGVPLRDNFQRTLPRVWVKHHSNYYKDTHLEHMKIDPSWTYAGEEIFASLADPAHKRGIKIYERMYEPSEGAAAYIKNFESVLETTIFGKRGHRPCMNNPSYQAWLLGSLEDLFSSYDLDGIQYGAERGGPLSDFLSWNNPPGCFCEHCVADAKDNGVDAEKAKAGLLEIHAFVSTLLKKGELPNDGVIVTFLRLLMKHPDVLAWEYLWPKTVNQLHRKIYDTVKSVKPNAHIGRHVDHQQSSYALLFRAAADYGEMTEANDFIKMILYHDIAGPRVLNKMANIRKHVLRELNEELSLRLYYALFGYDPAKEAGLDQIVEKGLSPYYVQREVERAVKQVNGGAAIYAGIGMDIPKGGGWGDEKWVSDPEEIHLAVKLAFGAGAKGVVASREYEEITVGSLQAMGKAVKEYRSL